MEIFPDILGLCGFIGLRFAVNIRCGGFRTSHFEYFGYLVHRFVPNEYVGDFFFHPIPHNIRFAWFAFFLDLCGRAEFKTTF